MSNDDIAKQAAADASLTFVRDGMRLGLGSGSTAALMVKSLGAKVRDGLRVVGVPTSAATGALAKEQGIPLGTLDDGDLDLAIDGADEVDPRFDMIKGGGGALLREKIVAASAKQLVIIVHDQKRVAKLGAFKLPIEVIRFAAGPVRRRLEAMGAKVVTRVKGAEPYITDEGNFILDADFGLIDEPRALAASLSVIPGVVEHGLFVAMRPTLIVAAGTSVTVLAAP
jgi:ribose 5-phosphate isomerase A